tara:strand:- start:7002 stop:7751 length:750 start_codon:yes stop_codon:yes gene_type:complete
MDKIKIIQDDAWQSLKEVTNARIALGSVGTAIPQREILKFKLAHAQAKDAIMCELDKKSLKSKFSSLNIPIYEVKSAVSSRDEYLKRPDLGRKLCSESIDELQSIKNEYEVVFILADGLSAEAINKYAYPFIEEFKRIVDSNFDCVLVMAEQARVAIGDEIGQILKAKFSIVLIGERPGLSSPESMGVYTTFKPQIGFTDERRNCISNIHNKGLNPKDGAMILNYLFKESMRLQISGVSLKVNLNKLLD